MRTTILPIWLLTASIICIGILAGCESVSITTNSSAIPPAITWSVTDRSTNALQQYAGNTTLAVKLGADYYITMHATSPSGVQTATIQPDESWSCLSTGGGEKVGQNKTADFASQTVTQTAHGGSAQDELFIFQAITFNMDCQSGFAFSGGGFGITGSATNFANMKTSATLSMNVSP